MTNLNFSISELCKSDRAKQNGIKNTPTLPIVDNMLELIVYCLQPVRDYLKEPMIITSGYRNAQLNTLVGGAKNSQHLEGKAADFIIKGESVASIIFKIQTSNLEYDQLINEYDKWVHISFNKGHNRKQYLKL
jgi:uncharacterized protein YcbK (DUF882 family)